jgi:hypothetical protein
MPKRHLWKMLIVAAGATAAVGLAGTGSAGAATPTTPDGALAVVKDLGGGAQYNAGHAVFVAKDLGGGSYWLTTTTAQDGLADGSEAGRDGLLTINQTVIVPAEQALADL